MIYSSHKTVIFYYCCKEKLLLQCLLAPNVFVNMLIEVLYSTWNLIFFSPWYRMQIVCLGAVCSIILQFKFVGILLDFPPIW